MSGQIDFNFTAEQQERFNLLWEETKKIHPNLVSDIISKEKAKVVLAHYIINKEITPTKEAEEIDLDLDKNI